MKQPQLRVRLLSVAFSLVSVFFRSMQPDLQTPTATPWIPMLLASPPKSSQSVIALLFSWFVGSLVSLAVYVLVSWLDGGAVVALALCSCFDVLCMHTSLDDKGKGKVQGGVGCPHSQGLSWPTFWSVLGFNPNPKVCPACFQSSV